MAAPTLEAIRYSRGKLQLLDQLKLPTETVFYALLHDTGHPAFKTFTSLVKSHG